MNSTTRAKRSQPHCNFAKLTNMQKKVLCTLTSNPRTLAQIYHNCCTYATVNEQYHCDTAINNLIKRELITIEIRQPTLYHLTPLGHITVQTFPLEAA